MELIKDQAFLFALEQGGVDNWEWYSESLLNFAEDLNKEARLVVKLPVLEVFEAFVEKEVENYISIQMKKELFKDRCNTAFSVKFTTDAAPSSEEE